MINHSIRAIAMLLLAILSTALFADEKAGKKDDVGKAVLIFPRGTVTTSLPTYSWLAVPSATWYYLWVNDSTTSSGKIKTWYTAEQAKCASGAGTCSVTPGTALAVGAAQWWIQTYGDRGHGPWSDGMSFSVNVGGPPPKATLLSPSGTVATSSPTYAWSAVASSTWYWLFVNDSRTQGKINQWYRAADAACSSGSGTCSVTPATVLAPGNCQWWIQTWNELGYGPWSDAKTFTVAEIPPPPRPTLISPSGNISTNKPTYIWKALSDAVWYQLWVADSTSTSGKIRMWYTAAQAGCASGAGNCSATPDISIAPGDAQWWIQAWYESGGYGPWSDPMSFKVTNVILPDKAILVYPSGTIASATPPYLWKTVLTATRYQLLVKDAAGTTKVQQWYTADQAQCFEETYTCSVKPAVTLAPGSYQWLVQTSNSNGDGPWSDPLQFAISTSGSQSIIEVSRQVQ